MTMMSRLMFPGQVVALLLALTIVGAGTVSANGLPAESDTIPTVPGEASEERATTLSLRDQMTLRMVQLAQTGRVPEAREVLRAYLRENPRDGTMLYNLTCLDLFLQEKEQALEDLEQALKNGYTNFRLIESDRDLILLKDESRFIEMVAQYEEEFRREFQARALTLDEGYPTEDFFLHPLDTGAVDSPINQPKVSVEFNSKELLVTLLVNDSSYNEQNPPWQGGCGVLVNLVLPLSLDDYESRRYFSYAFYARDGLPEGTLVGRHGKVLLQSDPRLKPEISRLPNGVRYDISIPWEFFAPYAPPLDQDMGLNIFYLGSGQGNSRPVFSLMPEARLSFEANSWRRYVPVSLFTSDRTGPVMRGRLYERLCQDETVGVQLALWSETDGPAKCLLSIESKEKPGIRIGAREIEEFPCETELNFYNHSLDISDLPSGSYQLRVEMTGPDGLTFSRIFPFENFEYDWISSLNERIHSLDTPEKSILKYHLFALSRRIETRHPHDDASSLHQAHAEVARMIELCETGSSCLPKRGLFRGGFSSDVMTQRFCDIYLPRGYSRFTNPQLLVVLPPEPGSEKALALSLGTALEGKSNSIVLVPQSHGFSSLATDKAAKNTLLAIQWAQSLFQSGAVTLVGLGNGTDAALETSLRRPDLCQEILLDVDALFQDMKVISTTALIETLGSRPNPRPYTLASKSPASRRPALIESAMKQLGLHTRIVLLDPSQPNSTLLASWFLSSR